IGLNSVTTWNQRRCVSDGHGYWTQPVNSSGVSTSANVMLIRLGATAVPSSRPMPEPASAPSTMNPTRIQARSARSESGPMIQRPIGNMSAPATSPRIEANSTLPKTNTMNTGWMIAWARKAGSSALVTNRSRPRIEKNARLAPPWAGALAGGAAAGAPLLVIRRLDTLPQHAAQQLAGDGPRHRLHELDLPRELVDGELRPAVVDELLLECLARGRPLLEHHERLGVLPADRVGNADDPDVGHSGVRGDRHLDLVRADAVPRGLDEVVLPGHEPEVAVLVGLGVVADQVPALPDHRLALARHEPRALLEGPPVHGPGRASGHHPAELVRRELVALVVHDLDLVAGDGGTKRAGPGPLGHHRRHEDVEHLGRAEAFEDLEPEPVLPAVIRVGGQRLAAARAQPHGRQVEALGGVRHLEHLPVGGGQDGEDGGVVLLHRLERRLWLEPGHEGDGGPEAERDDRHRPIPRGERQGGGAEQH